MMKLKTKQQIRRELEAEVNHFLQTGGAIQQVAQGESGKELGSNLNQAIPLSPEKQSRTLLTEEIQALDKRKHSKEKPQQPQTPKARKKIIYDDFGEPLREVWE